MKWGCTRSTSAELTAASRIAFPLCDEEASGSMRQVLGAQSRAGLRLG